MGVGRSGYILYTNLEKYFHEIFSTWTAAGQVTPGALGGGGQVGDLLSEGDGPHYHGDPHHQVEDRPWRVEVEIQALLDANDGAYFIS